MEDIAEQLVGTKLRILDQPQRHSYCVPMRNLTVSLNDALYERSRVLAAQRNTTVTAMVRDYLTSLSDAEQRYQHAREELGKMIGSMGGKIGRMPSREERNAR